MSLIYEIHDNGGRPYQVVLTNPDGQPLTVTNKNNVSDEKMYEDVTLDTCKYVGQPPDGRTLMEALADPTRIHVAFYRNQSSDGEEDGEEDVSSHTRPERHLFNKLALTVFIGYSPLTRTTGFSGGNGPYFDGNTVLCWLEDGSFLYACQSVKTFASERNRSMVRYVSEVGNNDVPYPYAVDSAGTYYLMEENVRIRGPLPGTATWPLANQIGDRPKFQRDPYNWYYDTCSSSRDARFYDSLPEDVRADYPAAVIVRTGFSQIVSKFDMSDDLEQITKQFTRVSGLSASILELPVSYDGPDIRPDWGEEVKMVPADALEIIVVLRNGKFRRVTADEFKQICEDLQERVGILSYTDNMLNNS